MEGSCDDFATSPVTGVPADWPCEVDGSRVFLGEDCGVEVPCVAGLVCPEGTCVEVEAAAGWSCNEAYYGSDDGCDCGCGIADPDCTDDTVESCEFCDDDGSCNMGECPGSIDPENNAVCI